MSKNNCKYGIKDCVGKVWRKCQKIPGLTLYRYDCLGKVICHDMYGCDDEGGWNIHHIIPISLDGADKLNNLVALNSHDNKSFGNKVLTI